MVGHCPECGSIKIEEYGTVTLGWRVLTWTENGEPEDYGDSREIDSYGDSSLFENRFGCLECDALFNVPA